MRAMRTKTRTAAVAALVGLILAPAAIAQARPLTFTFPHLAYAQPAIVCHYAPRSDGFPWARPRWVGRIMLVSRRWHQEDCITAWNLQPPATRTRNFTFKMIAFGAQ